MLLASIMADTRAPRPSTDEGQFSVSFPISMLPALDLHLNHLETAPLLHDPDAPNHQSHNDTFAERFTKVVQEPLTPLSKLLCVLALVFLLLSSVFIGLFAGAQHKLNNKEGDGGETKPAETVTVTYTTTDISTRTTTETTTSLSTTIATATTTATRTSTVTATISVPIPVPSKEPEEVR